MATNKYNIEVIENGKAIIIEMTCEERIAYELDLLAAMSDEEVCRTQNVDSRQDAIDGVIEYWSYIA